MNQTQYEIFKSIDSKAEKYHNENPNIYKIFKQLTFKAIEKGFKHYGVSGIFELIRWHTKEAGNDEFKINNNYKPFYSRLFERDHPEKKGFFRRRTSGVDDLFNKKQEE